MTFDGLTGLSWPALSLLALVACSSSNGGGTGGTSSTGTGSATEGATTAGSGGGTSGAGGQGATTAGSGGGTSGTGGQDSGTTSGTGGSGGSGSVGSCVCNDVLQGNMTVENALDVALLSSFCEITGDLLIQTSAIPTVSLPTICKVGGSVKFANGVSVQTLDLPALEIVGGDLDEIVIAGPVPVVLLPVLHTVGGELSILASAQVPQLIFATSLAVTEKLNMPVDLTLSSLQTAPGSIKLHGKGLRSFPALVSVGSVLADSPTSFPVLKTAKVLRGDVDVPLLEMVDELYPTKNGPVVYPSLTKITKNFEYGLGKVTSFDAPVLTWVGTTMQIGEGWTGAGQNFCVGGSQDLSSIHFPVLTHLGDGITVGFEPMLPKCQVDALAAQLVAAGWMGKLYGDCLYALSNAPCPP